MGEPTPHPPALLLLAAFSRYEAALRWARGRAAAAWGPVAGDGRGGFVVVEQKSGPRRTAHFDGRGELIREWYGAQTFFVHSWHNPHEPNHVWIDNGHGWVTECEVDHAAGTWRPYATYKLDDVGGEELNVHVQHTGYLGFRVRWHEGRK